MSDLSTEVRLEARQIRVRYGDTWALKGVDFTLLPGEIHALVGEHRAGKSSLAKVIAGTLQAYSGGIVLNRESVAGKNGESLLQRRVGMVYQDTNVLLPSLSVLENIFAGQWIRRWFGALNRPAMVTQAHRVLNKYGIEISLETPLCELSSADQQFVEIVRILVSEPEIIILDEISNKLTPAEMRRVYDVLFRLKKEGKSVIYISHDMDEVLGLAQRVTILKDGTRRATERTAELDKLRLVELTYSFALDQQEFETGRLRLSVIRRYLQEIIAQLPEAVFLADENQQVHLANAAALKLFDPEGASLERIDLNRLLKTEFPDVATPMAEALRAGDSLDLDEVTGPHGSMFRIVVRPLRDEGKYLGSLFLFEDVSTSKYLQEYAIRADKLASVAEVAAGVAHEINNPLYIIQNYVELLRRQPANGPAKAKLEKIDKELDRIIAIVGSLLSFSRTKDLPQTAIDLNDLVTEVLLLLQHKTSEKHIGVRVTRDDMTPIVIGDENRLKQLLMNLLQNAVEAVLEGGVVELGLRVDVPSGYVELSIRDNGHGIPKDVESHIFDPFFTTKVNRRNSGLGLSICYNIVESHGGVIIYNGRSNGMTTFVVRLPWAKASK
jgi:two-component system, NtrC family, sensor histidine kinase AtoS